MPRFTYIGDPNEPQNKQSSNETTFRDPTTGREQKFVRGESTDTPEWLAERLKTNNHFRADDVNKDPVSDKKPEEDKDEKRNVRQHPEKSHK